MEFFTIGYFADSFADCFLTYGAKPQQLKAPIGSRPSLDDISKALIEKPYKAITITHTDTSTGVLSDIKAVSELVHQVSPSTLVVVDGVCSVGCEEIRFDEWGIDVVLTASQKAIGVPAGLSILMMSGRAVETFKSRKTKPGSYFASMANWMPSKLFQSPSVPRNVLIPSIVMKNYEARKPSYFATPSPQLIHALHTSLTQILAVPLEDRFAKHKEVSKKIKADIAAMGLKQLASAPECQANGMTAVYLPEGVSAPELLPKLLAKGVVFAGGLHREIVRSLWCVQRCCRSRRKCKIRESVK
jgi:alanine-glyoxylate transaminase/serine-glyoxylate transaminase/serine-pyruvate transaminase